MQRPAGPSRPGGRTARTTAAVHAAVRRLLESGERAPQVAQIAAASGVHAATIYRRWGTADALLLEVAVSEVNRRAPVRSTGHLAADLLAYARQVHANVAEPEGLGFLRAIASAAADPLVGPEGATALLQGRLDGLAAMLDSAAEPAALTVIDLIDGLLAPIYLRALLSQPTTLTDDDLVRLVDNLLAIDRARAADTSRHGVPGRT